MKPTLSQLLTPEFSASLGIAESAQAIRKALAASPAVRELRQTVRAGIVTETDLRGFVEEITSQFNKGERFPYESALAALAFVLETRKTDFADEFLIDLARLRHLSEFRFAPEVGAISRLRWSHVPTTKSRRERIRPSARPRTSYFIQEITANRRSVFGQRFDSLETV